MQYVLAIHTSRWRFLFGAMMRRDLRHSRAGDSARWQEQCNEEMKVVVIAFGTRGDVQPLVIIAAGLVERSWCSEAVLVTHTQHSHFVHGLLAPSIPRDGANIDVTGTTGAATNGSYTAKSLAKFVPVDSPPIIWKGQGSMRYHSQTRSCYLRTEHAPE